MELLAGREGRDPLTLILFLMLGRQARPAAYIRGDAAFTPRRASLERPQWAVSVILMSPPPLLANLRECGS